MRLPGAWRTKRALRAARSRLIPHALILLYHRIADEAVDPEWLCVPPATFRAHMDILRHAYRPLGLRQLVAALRDGHVPRRSVVVTFDDGYVDNLVHAKPILEQAGVPATVFVASGYVGSPRQYWWDELAFYLLECPTLPRLVTLDIDGARGRWDCGERAADPPVAGPWNVVMKHDPSPRHAAYRRLAPLVKALPVEARERCLADLARLCGVPRPLRDDRRCCSPAELRALDAGGMVEVGAHGRNHPVLARLSAEDQQADIRQGKDALEAILGHAVTSFAYPYGDTCDYTPATRAAAQQAGFDCACANVPNWVRAQSDRFALPRFLARDWDGETFRKYLWEWDTQCQ